MGEVASVRQAVCLPSKTTYLLPSNTHSVMSIMSTSSCPTAGGATITSPQTASAATHVFVFMSLSSPDGTYGRKLTAGMTPWQ